MADSQALVVAIAAQQAVEFVGMPEAQLPLAHAAIYIATAPKSNSATVAIGKAMGEVKQGVTLAVPRHLTVIRCIAKASKELGHEGYKYSHDYEWGICAAGVSARGAAVITSRRSSGNEKRASRNGWNATGGRRLSRNMAKKKPAK